MFYYIFKSSSVDAEHAALHYVPDVDQYIIRDLGSSTGVCVFVCVCACVCAHTFVHVQVHMCLHGMCGVCTCVCVHVCMGVLACNLAFYKPAAHFKAV